MIYAVIDERFTMDHLGLIPSFLSEDDPRSAREQLDANYAHGGGWRPMKGFERDGMVLRYPGDPPFKPLVMTGLREEVIVIYPHGIVMILQKDGSFEAARMD